jgi:uncharacterized protein YfiM (DUF2279 family)
MPVKKIFILLIVFCHCKLAPAQADSLPEKSPRGYLVAGTALSFTGGFYLLYQSWYKAYAVGSFRFFDDSREWKGMDKIGHVASASILFDQFADIAGYSGYAKRQANLYALGSSMAFLTAIECMDGFSDGWGFSVADYAANVAGSTFSFLRRSGAGRNWPMLKYSWKPGNLSTLRPELLGRSVAERMLKNYNEQTYWLSFPLNMIFPRTPRWLCIATGYTADGMLGARTNSWTSEAGILYDYGYIERYASFKLSLDIDLLALPLKKKWQRKLVGIVRWIKIPAPGIEIRTGKNHGVSTFLW